MFKSKADSMAKPFASPRSSGGATFSVLGADMAIVGNIEAGADIHVDGRIDGDVTCHALVQGETSEITGAIRAESVRIAGLVRGTVAAREVVVMRTARIEGDIAYDVLTIEQGARIEGRLSPSGGQVPPAMAKTTIAPEAELVLTRKD